MYVCVCISMILLELRLSVEIHLKYEKLSVA